MKFQPAAKKELKRISIGTAVCTAIMLAVFGLLALCGVVKFDYTVVLGALAGMAVAILNFAFMCLSVQTATGDADDKRVHARMQFSYNMRLLAQAVWCILAYLLICFQPVAGILPLLFPRIVIYYLQLTGGFRSDAKKTAPGADTPERKE